jgi:hypothetical protein
MSDRSNNRKIFIAGREFESINRAAVEFGMSRNTLDYRLSKGWTPEEAVGLEPRPSHAARTPGVSVIVEGREFKTIKDAAQHYGRAYTWVIERLRSGRSIEEALGLIKRADSLQTEYPDIADQWHPDKNGSETPDSIAPHSGRIAWWLCERGHEWEAVINSRTRGHGCPYCAGQRPTKRRNLATVYTELLAEWDWEKNSPKTPQEFSPRSKYKVWWRCEKGHSWQAVIGNRARKTSNSCPCCRNQLLCADGTNSLVKIRPDIANDWHPKKNVPLTPADVVAGGSKKVWWLCKHGHEWKAAIGTRVIGGTGCPKCTNQTSRIEIAVFSELHALFDDIEWRKKIAGFECDVYLPKFNIGIEVDGVYWHSRKPDAELAKSSAFDEEGIQLFRLREDGLENLSGRDVSFKSAEDKFIVVSRLVSNLLKYADLPDDQRARLSEYVRRPGLVNEPLYREYVANLPAPPPGESLADRQPEIAKQWAYDLNAPLSPDHFRHKANKYVWWRCEDGHTWRGTINNRTQHGTGCPECPREKVVTVTEDWNLAAVFPELASEWHSTRNGELGPEAVRPKSNQKVWWLCKEGHEWEAQVASRADGSGCPYCYGRFATEENNLATQFPDMVGSWDYEQNVGTDPSQVTPFSGRKFWWRCSEGHSWQATVSNRTRMNAGCPTCAQKARRKYSIKDFQRMATERGGRCLSTTLKSTRNKLKFQCKEGHTWETRADSILYTNKWCPTCGQKHRKSRSANPAQLGLNFEDPS